ncbi:MAG: hypothetical protein JOZ37_16945 [Actinobacteria bacterium]|nr:hypothetical protein [Actinomycetota bacterium]
MRTDDEELGMEFHDRLTIVSGLGHAERREMVDLLLNSLTGGRRETSVLRYVDGTGRVVLAEAHDGKVVFTFEDNTPAPDPLAPLGLDLAGLRRISHVRGTDMDRLAATTSGPVPPELDEARRMLSELREQLEVADDAQRELEALRYQLAGVDEQLRDVTAGAPRRQFARLVLQLQQVRSEAALAGEQAGLAAADVELLSVARDVRALAGRWEGAVAQAEEARAKFGTRARLDAEELAHAATMPDHVPVELPGLAAELAMAESIRAELEAQLPAPTTSKKQKKPSHPAVPQLARADQDTLWRAARAVEVADERVNEASLALGGLDGGAGITPAIVQELDDAHDELERAEESVWKGMDLARKAAVVAAFLTVLCLVILLMGWGPSVRGIPVVPLLAGVAVAGTGGLVAWLRTAPRRRVAAAKAREVAALEAAGVPTYLAFQMRRIDPTLDRNAAQALENALADQKRAQSRWDALSGGEITAAAALAVEDEVRAQSAALRAIEGDTSDELRRRLVDEAEPAVDRARKAVLAVCAPFGVTDTDHAMEEVEAAVELAKTARMQTTLETVEAAEREATAALAAVLEPLGYVEPTPLDMRVRAFESAAVEADARQTARAHARPAEQVEADLVRLEAEVRLQAQPGWAMTATPADVEEPNIDDLQRQRTDLYGACSAAEARIPDVQRLRDRADTLERRVEVLETEIGLASSRGQADPELVEQHLLGRLAIARRAGGFESVPLLLDEPFDAASDTRVDALLDMIDRLSDRVQLIFLTDDSRVVGWARARRSNNSFSLLEPTPETV